MNEKIILSALGHTWILDLDGTIVKHNGYKDFGEDIILAGAKQFLKKLPETDYILFITSRDIRYKDDTERFLQKNEIRFNQVIYNVPYGERILINDNKPSGLKMAYAFSKGRDTSEFCTFEIDREI